uniref:LAGLIDADG homing endonuclease n=1 Tax=Clandestinovirus TaxID=2831644 RepID=A0A8F8PKI9_9VIRU|nr:LAGLIDADG homing endonuclease [Clandestinovirus]
MHQFKQAINSDVVYAGSVYRTSKDWRFVLTINKQTVVLNTYNINTHGEQQAHSLAENDRKTESNTRGLTIHRKIPPTQMIEYFAGFFDGDGCFGTSKDSNLRITLSQTSGNGIPSVLSTLQYYYGGCIRSHVPKRGVKEYRPHYKLRIAGPAAIWLLRDLENVSMIKANQVHVSLRAASEPLQARSTSIKSLKRAKLISNMQALEFNAQDQRLTWAYVAGLFDAEGCVRFPAGLRLRITQKSNPSILFAIKDKLGVLGKAVNNGVLDLAGKNAEELAWRILPFVMPKKDQLIYALTLRILRDTKVIDKSVAIIMAEKLKQMKKM